MKRYRDASGKLTRRILDICRETAAEASEYYQEGRSYAYRGRVYVLHFVGSNEAEAVARFSGAGGYDLFVDPGRLGTFLPDVASDGNEITSIGGGEA